MPHRRDRIHVHVQDEWCAAKARNHFIHVRDITLPSRLQVENACLRKTTVSKAPRSLVRLSIQRQSSRVSFMTTAALTDPLAVNTRMPAGKLLMQPFTTLSDMAGSPRNAQFRQYTSLLQEKIIWSFCEQWAHYYFWYNHPPYGRNSDL